MAKKKLNNLMDAMATMPMKGKPMPKGMPMKAKPKSKKATSKKKGC